ncbi:MAG: glycoside hydrolase family 15 protein, partial [Gemmatimonadota bacterium]|nr:glycoside hydrolase family 15 protein [Gemmatimonadota bacterium]
MSNLNLAIIGNCSFAALVNTHGRIVWAPFPHFDGDPFFGSLLHEPALDDPEARGFYEITLDGQIRSEQHYLPNTAILVTTLEDDTGCAIEITDFAPRFHHYGRFFRPPSIVRLVRPLRGTPRIRIRLRPMSDYGGRVPEITTGSNHARYMTPGLTMRLTTNVPLSYVLRETPFLLHDPVTLLLGPDESLTRPITATGRDLFERTRDYWHQFVRFLHLPFEWQDAVIRAAITLKLCSFEDTGAIVAAVTTSIPEAPNSGRNWDYRYCWLRDAYFVVHALNRLGTTETLERYLGYLSNLAAGATDGYLQPVYGIHLEQALPEREATDLRGYHGMGPVRIGNQAYQQVQNDGYGSAILAVAQVFFDERLQGASVELFERLEKLGMQAHARFDQPDAGLWEFRDRPQVHTFSSVMCWAACDRLARIARRLGLADRAHRWEATAAEMHATIITRAWSPKLGRFAAVWDNEGTDASLLLLNHVGFLERTDPRFQQTVDG